MRMWALRQRYLKVLSHWSLGLEGSSSGRNGAAKRDVLVRRGGMGLIMDLFFQCLVTVGVKGRGTRRKEGTERETERENRGRGGGVSHSSIPPVIFSFKMSYRRTRARNRKPLASQPPDEAGDTRRLERDKFPPL